MKITLNEQDICYLVNESIRQLIESYTSNKPNITILWLDDQREPNSYFQKERKNSGAWTRNNDYYQNNIFNQYNVNFVWVKNLSEFQNYIINNEMPEIVSFDHDIKPKGYVGDFENGADCARWLIGYCRENNISLPKCYAHTANKSKLPIFDDIFNSLNEVVYADNRKIDTKKKKLGITYSKGNYAKGNQKASDKLVTDKMESNDGNTYEVPLKGGIMSYNITDIKGTDIMHFFKKTWANRSQKTSMDVTIDGEKESYELEMEENELREFITAFVKKVERVINYWISNNKSNLKNFIGISIYPVPSSSNFNNKFVKEELSRLNINGFKPEVINSALLQKDLRDLQRDNEFIEKNKDFYNDYFSNSHPEMGTINQRLNNHIRKQNTLKAIDSYVTDINKLANQILNFMQNNDVKNTELTERNKNTLIKLFTQYVDKIRYCFSISYVNEFGEKEGIRNDKILRAKKYSKGPSIEGRSKLLWKLVKPYLTYTNKIVSPVDGKKYEEIPLCEWERPDFEIKSLRNSERLGLKNYYNPNYSGEYTEDKQTKYFDFQKEIEKIKGTIFLIFDDNISGGATLSDICYQCKQLGIENIIPITFGQMQQSNNMRGIVLNTPKNGYDFS